MTANQRRPGFRLPWVSESDDPNADVPAAPDATADGVTSPQPAAPQASATADASGAPAVAEAASDVAAPAAEAAASEPAGDGAASAATAAGPAAAERAPEPAAVAAEAPAGQAPAADDDDFSTNLIAAMRGVADEARQTGVAELRARAEAWIKKLEETAEGRRQELRTRAEADVAAVAEWERAEAERIRKEAEQRVVARRAQLDQELAADASRTEADTAAVRERVANYERELDAYHAQLSEITDPAAFAAAAKRLPQPPDLEAAGAVAAPPAAPAAESAPAAAGAEAQPTEGGPSAEALAQRLAALDATLPDAAPAQVPEQPVTEAGPSEAAPPEASAPEPTSEAAVEPPAAEAAAETPTQPAEPAPADPAPAPAPAPVAEPATTEVVVKGLGSFGAITGFRQALSGVDGIESVALSLGQTGEFVFRASHAAGFDMRAAIHALEGDGAKIEDRPEGGLRVTLERAR